jgi:hypothetical protein
MHARLGAVSDDDEPPREVRVEPFDLTRTEVTLAQCRVPSARAPGQDLRHVMRAPPV